MEVYGGSFDRIVATAESGGNNGAWGYYANIHYFEEDGWRDLSDSDAINFYGGLSWRSTLSSLNLNVQHGDSELLGNGAIPIELLPVDREAIFTAPDRTENDLIMISLDGTHAITDNIKLSGNAFYRENKTDSFNGDGSEFETCEFEGGGVEAFRIVEEDDLDEIIEEAEDEGALVDSDDECEIEFADRDALDDFLEDEEDDFVEIENAAGDDFMLTEEIAESIAAINNISSRKQQSYGADMQLTFLNDLFGNNNQLILGVSYFNGESSFTSVTELAGLDPDTRSTEGLGTGAFADEAETDIDTETETVSFYFMNTMDLTEQLTLTVSGRLNNTLVELEDQSGEAPELNGEHDYFRFNPAIGLTYQFSDAMNMYGSYSESNRAPTPIELACNDSVFARARAAVVADGDDPDDVEFECRLPNAFLADPPLEDVVTKSFETGIRGNLALMNYHLGFYHSRNNNDILFQTTGRSTGLFANVDETQRMGFEGRLNGSTDKLGWFLAYSYLEATFEDDFLVLSPNHPSANDDGEIAVGSGDRIPGLPEHSFKLGADYQLFEKFTVGFDLIYNSGVHLRADESNELDKLDGYAVVNLRGSYRFNDNIEIFAKVNNVFDANHENFGLLGEEPDEVEVELFEDFEDPTFVGPGAPIGGFVGIKASL